MDRLFDPTRVAVYGASTTAGSMGARLLANLQRGGGAQVVAINPRHRELAGIPCFPSASAYGASIDHAVVAVRADQVCAAVEDLATVGTSAATILAGGFAETGIEGRHRQAAVLEAARRGGMRLFGPNCLGWVNTHAGVYASPGAVLQEVWPDGGPLAIVSQSGALGGDALARFRRSGVGVAFWASTGNEIDLTIAEGIACASALPDVRVIAVYLEEIRDPSGLRRALRAAADRDQTVVVLRAGRTEIGARAVRSHTAALVPPPGLYEAVLGQAGAVTVANVRELVETVRVALTVPHGDPRVAVVSSSGGAGAIAADVAAAADLRMARLTPTTRRALRAAIPNGSFANPIDVTGAASTDPALLQQALDGVFADPGVDVVLVIQSSIMTWADRAQRIAHDLGAISERHGRGRVLLAGNVHESAMPLLTASGIAVFDEASTVIESIARLNQQPAPPPWAPWRVTTRASSWSEGTIASSPLDTLASLELLAAEVDLPVVEHRLIESRSALQRVSRTIPGPWTVKAVLPGNETSPDAARQDVRSGGELRDAWSSLAAVCEEHGVPPRVVVQPHLDGIEVLIGAFLHETLGPFIVVGAAGVRRDLVPDAVVWPAPVDRRTARWLLASLPAWHSTEGAAPHARPDLVRAVVAVSRIVGTTYRRHGARIVDIEIDPVVLTARGSWVVDGVVALERGHHGYRE